ncbi:uncharacterized protein LOC135695351 [Rhopilema esculentum]|uniref:uncharacterized protein LOC135695351 n=1 Tax=Rhopilema esculentum TaxID=499914 RepID=UPI0031CFE82D|eukprot:gene11674-21929_t
MANGRFHLHVNGTNYIITGTKNERSYKDILCTIAKKNDSETDMNDDQSVEIVKVKAKKTRLQSSCNRDMLKKNKRKMANAALSLTKTSQGGASCKKNVKKRKQEKRNREADKEYTIEDSDTETFHQRRTKMKCLMAARLKDGLDKIMPNHTKTAYMSLLQKTASKNQFGEQLSHFDKISIYAIDETSLKRAFSENVIKDTECDGPSKCIASFQCEANQSRRSNQSTEEVVPDDKDSGVPSLESEDQLPKDEIRAEQRTADKKMKLSSCEAFQINRNLTQESRYVCPCMHRVHEQSSTTPRKQLTFGGQAKTELSSCGHRRGRNNDIKPKSDGEYLQSFYHNLFLTFHGICNKDGKEEIEKTQKTVLYCQKQDLDKGIKTICNSTEITNTKEHLKKECTVEEQVERHIVSGKKSIRASKSKRREDISTNSNSFKLESKLKTIANPTVCLQKPGDHGKLDVTVAGLKNDIEVFKSESAAEEERQSTRCQGCHGNTKQHTTLKPESVKTELNVGQAWSRNVRTSVGLKELYLANSDSLIEDCRVSGNEVDAQRPMRKDIALEEINQLVENLYMRSEERKPILETPKSECGDKEIGKREHQFCEKEENIKKGSAAHDRSKKGSMQEITKILEVAKGLPGAVPPGNDLKTKEELDTDIEKQLNRFQGSSIICTKVNGWDENNNEIGNRPLSMEHKSEGMLNVEHECEGNDEFGHNLSEDTERKNIWDRYISVCQSIVEISERLLYFDLLYEQLTMEITQIEMQENLVDNDTLEYDEQMIIQEIIGFKKNLKEITLLSRRQGKELLENRKELIRLDTILKERKSILGNLQEFVFVKRIQSAPRQLRKSHAKKRKIPNK